MGGQMSKEPRKLRSFTMAVARLNRESDSLASPFVLLVRPVLLLLFFRLRSFLTSPLFFYITPVAANGVEKRSKYVHWLHNLPPYTQLYAYHHHRRHSYLIPSLFTGSVTRLLVKPLSRIDVFYSLTDLLRQTGLHQT
jgi:hypothetical protein